MFDCTLYFPLQESNMELHKPALEALRTQIRSSTSSMTSVPKPLKFLRPHYGTLKDLYEKWGPGENKVQYTLPPPPPTKDVSFAILFI